MQRLRNDFQVSKKEDRLRIGILGTRGIPNSYGGFEAFAEAISTRLVNKGHRVTVYCSHNQNYQEKTWKGVELKFCKNPESRVGTTGQFIYDLNCNLHARKQPFDILLHLGYTSDSVWAGLWSKKTRHLTNMDGIEWKRSKYSPAVQTFLHRAEKRAASHSSMLIADSRSIFSFLDSHYETPVVYISYGAEIPPSYDEKVLRKFQVQPYEYDLVIARMEPENNIELAIKAKFGDDSSCPLLIFSNVTKYGDHLISKYTDFPLIRFQGALYQREILDSLRHYSRYYIHGHSVGGTNPSLLEAMACGCRILAHDNNFNRDILQDNANYYTNTGQLSDHLKKVWLPDQNLEQIGNNLNTIRDKHNWDAITHEYESVFYQALEL